MSEGVDPLRGVFRYVVSSQKKCAVKFLKVGDYIYQSVVRAWLVKKLPCPRIVGSAAEEIIGQSVIKLTISSRARKHDNEIQAELLQTSPQGQVSEVITPHIETMKMCSYICTHLPLYIYVCRQSSSHLHTYLNTSYCIHITSQVGSRLQKEQLSQHNIARSRRQLNPAGDYVELHIEGISLYKLQVGRSGAAPAGRMHWDIFFFYFLFFWEHS